MQTHVYIATTQGPIAIQRLVAEEPDVQSVICVDGGIEPLPISGRYHDFVRKGTGFIQRDFGQPAYRMDVSARVDQGNSWQLPAYIAHYLSSEGLLGNGDPQPGDQVIWATGALKADRTVIAVEEVFNKLNCSKALFEQLWQQQIPLLLVVPSENEPALLRWQNNLKQENGNNTSYQPSAVRDLDQVMGSVSSYIYPEKETEINSSSLAVDPALEPEITPPPDSDMEPTPSHTGKSSSPSKAISLLVMVALVASGLGFAAYKSELDISPHRHKVDLMVELGDLPGGCNQNRVEKKTLHAVDGKFPDMPLSRLCAIWATTSESVKSLVGVSLDNGSLLPIQFSVDKWRIQLPQQRYRARDYALLALDVEYLDSIQDQLNSQLQDIDARKNGVSIEFLENFIDQNNYNGKIFQQRLTYKKKSADSF